MHHKKKITLYSEAFNVNTNPSPPKKKRTESEKKPYSLYFDLIDQNICLEHHRRDIICAFFTLKAVPLVL